MSFEEDDTLNFKTLAEKQQYYADKRDCRIRTPEDTEAFLDIDSDEALAVFKHRWITFKRAEPSADYSVLASPSGKFGHYHVIVEMPRNLKVIERLWIQSLLGDDPLRGLLSYKEARDYGDPSKVSVLFEKYKKREAPTVVKLEGQVAVEDIERGTLSPRVKQGLRKRTAANAEALTRALKASAPIDDDEVPY
jgi:hypothetical protein